MIKKRSGRNLIIRIPLLVTIGILAYYQLLYKSPRVDNGVAALAIIFYKHRHNVTAVRFLPGDSLVVTSSVDSLHPAILQGDDVETIIHLIEEKLIRK